MFKVKPETISIKQHESRHDMIGDATHDAKMIPSSGQLRAPALPPTTPAASIAPTTVCVPEIGIPDAEENIMKQKEDKHTANIIRSFISISIVLMFLITSYVRVADTLSEQNIAPTNSAIAPLPMMNHIGIALVP